MPRRLFLSAPDVGELEQEYVLEAMRSGWVAPAGPDLTALEKEMADRVGVAHAVATSSGTAALHLALVSLGVGAGDVVVVPTMTFVASANAVCYTGAAPCFVDVDRFGNLDPELLESAMASLTRAGRHVRAIMTVDLLGRCADYEQIDRIAERYGVPIVEDAAEALGATRAGRAAGSFGDAAVLSFNGNKVMTTSGGGMLLTDRPQLAEHCRHLSTQARENVVHYEHRELGYNYRMSNILAALGRAQLSRLDSMIARRRAIRRRYEKAVSSVAGVEVFAGESDEADNCWLTSLVVDQALSGFYAAELADHLESHDIECRPLWKPMHMQPLFAEAEAFISGNAEDLFRRGITLPSGSGLTDPDVARVCAAVDSFVRDA